MARAQKESSSTSELAKIFYAILELKADRILIADLVAYLNRDRVPKECFTNKEVSALVSVLGFLKKRMTRGIAVIWNDEIVARLNEQYGLIEKEENVGNVGKNDKTQTIETIFDSGDGGRT